MSDYKVEMFDLKKNSFITRANCKIKHFRLDGEFDPKTKRYLPAPMGGHTVLVDLGLGRIHSSKCRSDECFSRRKGVLTCIQKMLEASFKETTPLICKFNFIPNGVQIWLARSPEAYLAIKGETYKPYFWL